ncbi:MAG: ATP synthase F1 subunit delta, partial [Candidatus Bipolaricaulia bacterium]
VAYLGEILSEFIELREEREGLAHALVYSPYPLEGLLDRIKAKLTEVTGRRVRLEERLDRSLIGGIKLQLGDLVLDGSVRAQLERLREELLEEGGS